jgi:hypothetical protein
MASISRHSKRASSTLPGTASATRSPYRPLPKEVFFALADDLAGQASATPLLPARRAASAFSKSVNAEAIAICMSRYW